MAVFRIERTRDYTVMSNHHLRNANLSLKAKGLLSMMLSLPEDWNYTTRGLAKICKEGVDAIGAALRELEAAGYIVRHKLRDRQGRISDTEYVIYEQPQLRKPDTDSPDTENPYMDKPDTEKPAELNIEKSNTQKQNIYGSSTDSIPFRDCAADCLPERNGRDAMSLTEIESYRELIQENIEYDCLKQRYPLYLDDLNEIVELLVETVCARRKTPRISGSDLGALPSTSKRRGKSQRDFLLCGPVCINTGIACLFSPKMKRASERIVKFHSLAQFVSNFSDNSVSSFNVSWM